MTESQGTYLVDRIRSRCVEEGECLIWQGAMSGGYTPSMRHEQQSVNIRHFLWRQSGKQVPAGKAIVCKLGERRCVEISHLYAANRGSKVGTKWTAAQRARFALSAQRSKSPLDWEKVNAIRFSDDTAAALAREYGVAERTIRSIRSGERWAPPRGVFTGLGARA